MLQHSATIVMIQLLVGLLVIRSGPGVAPAPAHAEGARFVRVKVETANLRDGPGLQADSVRYAYENEPLQLVGREGAWLQVRDFDGDSAWIYGPLTDRRPAAIVTRELVNVRTQPGTEHPVAFTAERMVNLLVLGREGRWLHVQHEIGTGWVHESLVWGPS
jgi:SH3-like domain-containing protein